MKKHGKLLAAALGVYVLLLILLVATEARAPDANIRNVWDAIWYSLITMTTVGYGDLSPVTPAGRVLGLIFALSSIGSCPVCAFGRESIGTGTSSARRTPTRRPSLPPFRRRTRTA